MVGVCKYPECEALCFIQIRIGKRLEWWSCEDHYDALFEDSWRSARPWERISASYPSAVVVMDLQAWRTWKQLTLLAYDELRQIGV